MNQASLHKLLAAKNFCGEKKELEFLFELRLATNLTLIKTLFFELYPEEKNTASFKKLLDTLPQLFQNRPESLKQQDLTRIHHEDWYKSADITGMQLYVDNFSNDLKGLQGKIDYFEKLGVNFLHLMPITPRPKGENDGGYAGNSYQEVDHRYGTKDDLLALTETVRDKNNGLMLDI